MSTTTNSVRDGDEQHTTNDQSPTDNDTDTVTKGDATDFISQITDDDGYIFNSYWNWKSLSDEPEWEDTLPYGKTGEKRREPLTNPETIGDDTDTQTTVPSPDDDPKEFLAAVAPDKLDELTDKFSGMPDLLNEHIEYHANRLRDEAPTDTTDSPAIDDFVITHEQESTRDIWAGVDGDGEDDWTPSVMDEINGDTRSKSCPECGSEDISDYQQQTGSADEGMTSFNKCTECGHSWRGGYGG